MQITDSSKILLGATNTFNLHEGCKEIIITNNFLKLNLDINSSNLTSILITDSRIGDCQDNYNITKCCSRNSTFCIENKNPTTNQLKLNYCMRQTYLYACILDQSFVVQVRRLQGGELAMAGQELLMDGTDIFSLNDNTEQTNNFTDLVNISSDNTTQTSFVAPILSGVITLKTETKKGEGCQTAEFIPEVGCSTLGLQNCKDSQLCSDQCMYVECRTDLANADSRVFSMCLPVNLTDNDITNRCSNHITFSQSQPYVYKKSCLNSIDNRQAEISGYSSRTLFKFLLFILGTIIIVLFIASVYYRFSKKYNDGIPPFEAPWFFPNFIFPK